MIRVLIVDDSLTARTLLRQILSSDPDIEIVGEAETGREGVELAVELSPDLITMDLVMPDMDGLEATRRIMKKHPVPVLVVTANPHYKEVNVVFEALNAGALDLTTKAAGFGETKEEEWERGLIRKVKALAETRTKAVIPPAGS